MLCHFLVRIQEQQIAELQDMRHNGLVSLQNPHQNPLRNAPKWYRRPEELRARSLNAQTHCRSPWLGVLFFIGFSEKLTKKKSFLRKSHFFLVGPRLISIFFQTYSGHMVHPQTKWTQFYCKILWSVFTMVHPQTNDESLISTFV